MDAVRITADNDDFFVDSNAYDKAFKLWASSNYGNQRIREQLIQEYILCIINVIHNP